MVALMQFVWWVGLSFYVWPQMIGMTSGWIAAFFILTWPVILASLPFNLALYLSGGLVKDFSRKLNIK